ncbi:MAG: hypothetical protein ACK52I_05335, partial [Pseudomonadota bacterium]
MALIRIFFSTTNLPNLLSKLKKRASKHIVNIAYNKLAKISTTQNLQSNANQKNMLAISQEPRMSIKEYLEWEPQQDLRHEYINGEVFAMT